MDCMNSPEAHVRRCRESTADWSCRPL